MLELFAFVRPARFCVPTPRGIAAALGLAPPRTMADACVALIDAARALLQELQADGDIETRALAEIAESAGWGWGPAVLAALPAGRAPERHDQPRLRPRAARLAEPAGMAGARAAARRRATIRSRRTKPRQRLASLLGADAEPRPQQADYAAAVAAAFAPRDHPDAPRAVLAEAGTGVGKTLGYIAPASLWAEKNEGAVWLSTYTRNLQSQIDGELDRLYPDPAREAPPRRDPQGSGKFPVPAELRGRGARGVGAVRAIGGGAGADRALGLGDRLRRPRWPATSRAGLPS